MDNTGRIMAFVIWIICSLLFVVIGIYVMKSKKTKPFGFWANAEAPEVSDVEGYNKALGKLWIIFGVGFAVDGLPLLAGQNSALIIISVIGAMFLSIGVMVYYTLCIEAKYKKK
ncbi:MAG: hypothetical protein E7257_05810 [Lachnospiraceae bacterium]|nr:hypothetical protein [Lachnospiraceae bacterium]